MRVLPTLVKSFTTHNKVPTQPTKNLTYVVNTTADRMVQAGFWGKVEHKEPAAPYQDILKAFHKFNARCMENTQKFAQRTLQPLGRSCVETYETTVTKLHDYLGKIAITPETNFVEFQEMGLRHLTIAKPKVLPKQIPVPVSESSVTGGQLVKVENRPFRNNIISAVRVMADIILPPRYMYMRTEKILQ